MTRKLEFMSAKAHRLVKAYHAAVHENTCEAVRPAFVNLAEYIGDLEEIAAMYKGLEK